MLPISLSLIRCPARPVRSRFSLHMTAKQLHQMKTDVPLDTQKAVYQNSNFLPADYNVVLSPLKLIPVISLKRIQTNPIVLKVDKVRSQFQRGSTCLITVDISI